MDGTGGRGRPLRRCHRARALPVRHGRARAWRD